MKNKIPFIICLYLFFSTIFFGAEKKTLVYLLDGCRADVMTNLDIASWKMLKDEQWATGYHTAWTLQGATCPDLEPSSGQNHTTTVTGLSGIHHKITTGQIFETYEGPIFPTFLEYLGQKNPDCKTASFYGWSYDWVLRPEHGQFQLITAGDVWNSKILLKMLNGENCADAIFVQDNDIDLGGHRGWFYPYGPMYKEMVEEAMTRFGKALEAIHNRPTFNQEDWLIVLCSDHGGWMRTHGKIGGHSSNIPLLVCGKNIPSGMMNGRYDLRDVTPWVLNHFGLTDILPKLDGKAEIHAAYPVILPQEEGQILHFSPDSLTTTHTQAIRCPGLTDSTENKPFSMAFHIKADLANREGNTILFSNNDNQTGTPGFTIFLDKTGELRMTLGCKDAPNTFLVPQSDRMELGPLHLNTLEDNIIIISITADNTVTMAHKAENDYLYWFSCDSSGLRPLSGKEWKLGYLQAPIPLNGTVNNITIWDRALSIPEIQAFVKTGKNK